MLYFERLVRADLGRQRRVEVGLGDRERRHVDGVAGFGFVVVECVAGVRQRADAHAVGRAVVADLAGGVQRRVAPRQRGPVGLDRVLEHLQRLHGVADPHVEGERDLAADRDLVARIPAEDRAVGAVGRRVDVRGRVRAADVADVAEVDAGQVVEDARVVGRCGAVVGRGDGDGQNVAGVGRLDREVLG